MDKNKRVTLLAIAEAMMAAIAGVRASTADAAEFEKCYGIALKGENDCATADGTTCAGTSTIDYDGKRWKTVSKGACVTTQTPFGSGSLEPIKRPT